MLNIGINASVVQEGREGREVFPILIGNKIIPMKDSGILSEKALGSWADIKRTNIFIYIHMSIFLPIMAELFLRLGTYFIPSVDKLK